MPEEFYADRIMYPQVFVNADRSKAMVLISV